MDFIADGLIPGHKSFDLLDTLVSTARGGSPSPWPTPASRSGFVLYAGVGRPKAYL